MVPGLYPSHFTAGKLQNIETQEKPSSPQTDRNNSAHKGQKFGIVLLHASKVALPSKYARTQNKLLHKRPTFTSRRAVGSDRSCSCPLGWRSSSTGASSRDRQKSRTFPGKNVQKTHLPTQDRTTPRS